MDITEPANFEPVPADWFVAVTDVRDSARAVREGRHKNANLPGACSIVGLAATDESRADAALREIIGQIGTIYGDGVGSRQRLCSGASGKFPGWRTY
jgi:hypothetical protein